MIGHECEIAIETIGRSGDGTGHLDDKPVFVPSALPGDRLRIRLTTKRGYGYVAAIIAEHHRSERAAPPCPHFGRCGGCQLQHLTTDSYRRWKVQQIEATLASRGFADIDIRPLIKGKPATRRRLRLAFPPASGRRLDESPYVGFRARQSREIVPIETCPVARPSLLVCLPALNDLLKGLDLAKEGGELHLTATDTGIDLLMETAPSPNLADLERLGLFADQHDLARLAWRPNPSSMPEPIAERRPVTVSMGGIPVPLPIGAFLQATEQAEHAIRDTVSEAIGSSSQLVGDLFAGCGAFGLPFAAAGRRVIAFERDPAMVNAMKAAARSSGIDQHLSADERDLDRQPLDHADLNDLDAVVIDPPRAGARTQVNALAASAIKKIAMVSCNPATFARDARILADGGYRLSWIQPIDAFLWSAQIELVGAFERRLPLDL